MVAVMEHARRYVAAGLSVIPVRADGSKAPAVGRWEPYQDRRPMPEELDYWFPDGRAVGVGVVCGEASHNLAVLDFESKEAWDGWLARLAPHLKPLLATCPVVRTPGGGRHVYCSIEEGWVAGGVLARHANKDVKIEVRGQGNYVVAPGSPAACHETGNLYDFEVEGWMAAGVPVRVTLEQFAEMCDLAREFNEWTPPEYQHRAASPSGGDPTGAPGWDFNHRGTWDETGLFEAGWKWARQSAPDKGTVRRPGKDGVGISGTVGLITSQANGWPLFWNFSTSAPDFDPERAYTRFAVFATLKHKGDFSAAARELRSKGYGAPREPRQETRYNEVPPPEKPVAPEGGWKCIPASALTEHVETAEWLWEGYIPCNGITLLSALWKAGKTTLLSHILKAFDGEADEFLGKPVRKCKILYVTEEMERHWSRRVKELGLGDHAWFHVQPFNVKPGGKDWVAFLEQVQKDVEHHKFELVIFDTLAELWPVAKENDAGEVQQALAPLRKITKAGAALLLVHHLRKSGGAEYTGSRGSGVLCSFPDIIVEMTRNNADSDNDDNRRVLRAQGRYEETPKKQVLVWSKESGFSLEDVRTAVQPETGAGARPGMSREDRVL